ncbi:hypothetical protein RhiJN_11086 [Ceratobasidium sp. AG-Ba]|nr:hypothetical protein RhiJN_11086 [Ceratobasidium sp. AG-Ba]
MFFQEDDSHSLLQPDLSWTWCHDSEHIPTRNGGSDTLFDIDQSHEYQFDAYSNQDLQDLIPHSTYLSSLAAPGASGLAPGPDAQAFLPTSAQVPAVLSEGAFSLNRSLVNHSNPVNVPQVDMIPFAPEDIPYLEGKFPATNQQYQIKATLI